MNIKSVILLLSAAVLLSACEEKLDPRIEPLQQAALESDLAWNLVESLTNEVGQRMGGSPGDAKGITWARQNLHTMSFDRVWTEPFVFPRWRRGAESAVLMPGNEALTLTALGGSPATPEDGVQANVIAFATVEALEDANEEEVAGKIVYIGRRMERRRDGSDYGPTVRGRSQGPMIAAEKGAVALLIRSVGTDEANLPHTGMISNEFERERVPSAALGSASADLLEQMIAGEEPVSIDLNLQTGYSDNYTSANVMAEIKGSERPDEIVAIGAHLDSWDLGTGAIDDGAGVALVMAAAQLVLEQTGQPERTIRVILYGNEEQGVWGGKAYAREHAEELANHIAGAESDLGAYPIYSLRTRVAPEAEDFIALLARALEPLNISRDTEKLASGGADLGEMRKLGMPAIDLRQEADVYFDYHHTPADTLDKINPQDLQQNLAAWVTLVFMLANSDAVLGPIDPEPPKTE